MGGRPRDPEVTNYPEWKKVAWRFLRGAVAGGIGSTTFQFLLLNADLTDPNTYLRALVSAFVTGALLGVGKLIRTESDSGLMQKLPV